MSTVTDLMDARQGKKLESKTRRAAKAMRNAGIERRYAHQGGSGSAPQVEEAERLETIATALMVPERAPTVRSGEISYAPDNSGPPTEIADTLRNPDQAAIDASVERTDLLLTPHADIVALAVDAAASAKAENSFEKMLAHQAALIHALTMKTGCRALEFEKRQGMYGEGFKQADSIELGRLASATARLSTAFQDALLTLQRLKNGGSQSITVKHVTMQPGAQAVFGNVKGGGKGLTRPPRGTRRK